MRSLLIVDHTLKSYDGHSYNYDMAVAKAASHVFDRVDVYGDKHFRPKSDRGVIPVLENRSAWSVSLAKRGLARLRAFRSDYEITPCHARKTPAESCEAPSLLFRVQRYLRAWETVRAWEALAHSNRCAEETELDIFVQHACMAELVATESLANRRKFKNKRLRVHLVVRHSPERTCSRFESLDRLKLRLERLNALTNPKVYFYTDSRLLREAFQSMVSDPFQFKVLPIPVSFSMPKPRRRGERIRLGFLGSPRLEKGFGLIPDILHNVPPVLGETPLELAVQTLEYPDEPEVRRINRWLHTLVPDSSRLPLTIWQGPVPTETYFGWFSSTDILLGLYTSSKYLASTSGVFVEALHCGVPTVTFEGTWVSDQIADAAGQGLHIGETIATVRELPDKVERIVRDLDRYQRDTLTYLEHWRRFHTPERVVAMLWDPGEEAPFGHVAAAAGDVHA